MNKTEKWNFLQGNLNYSIENKRTNEVGIINTIFNKTLGMFNYENLPDSLPREEMEKILQTIMACLSYHILKDILWADMVEH